MLRIRALHNPPTSPFRHVTLLGVDPLGNGVLLRWTVSIGAGCSFFQDRPPVISFCTARRHSWMTPCPPSAAQH